VRSTSAHGSGALADAIVEALEVDFSLIIARSILRSALHRVGVSQRQLERRGMDNALLEALCRGTRMYAKDARVRRQCSQRLRGLALGAGPSSAAAPSEEGELRITTEDDIVAARQKARLLATQLGFGTTTRIKIATAVSELARNMYRYAGGGSLSMTPVDRPRHGLRILAEDRGPGIPNLDEILAGDYRSRTGMGLGILGCKRLMDEFEIHSSSEGTRVVAHKFVSE
jgi:serine/threonine-protein kinase RsbT